jgi:UDP-N-acetyl-D-glucosamine dehydrogenase
MPQWVVSKVADALNERGKAVKSARILVLGIVYKKNVDDRRESPSMVLMGLLQSKGAEVSYSDPHVPRFLPMRKHDFALESVPLKPLHLAAVDCVLLATDHDRFDYALIQAHAPLIVDTRGRYREPAEHIVRA